MKTYNAIRKMTGHAFNSRMVVKTFKDSDSMHKFLNAQNDNSWADISDNKTEYKAGTYAFAGQAWHNVKTLPASLLSHV